MNSNITLIRREMPDRKERALSIINAIRHNIYDAFYQMQILRDEELYRDLGYNSFQECLINELNVKKTTFYDYQKIIDKFLPEATNLNDSAIAESHRVPIKKLILLSRLPKPQTLRLFKEGKISIRGREFTIAEINKLPYEKLKVLVTKKHKYIDEQEEIAVTVESIKKIEKNLEKKLNSFLAAVYACNLISEASQEMIQNLADEISKIITNNLNANKR
ncbi:hypothetical protein ACSSV9_13895 [Melioribacter sp. OK-6-Me]